MRDCKRRNRNIGITSFSHTHRNPISRKHRKKYAVAGKEMLIVFIAVLALCIIFIGLQLYFLIRRCHHLLLFSSYAAAAATNAPLPTKGLSPSVLQSLPTFHYSAAYEDNPLECSVCLSEFQENEMGRILPNCNHAFHVECIDMWFLSHSNCPLCRLPIQLPHNPADTIIMLVNRLLLLTQPVTETNFIEWVVHLLLHGCNNY